MLSKHSNIKKAIAFIDYSKLQIVTQSESSRFSHILPAGRANLLDGFAISRTFSTEYIRGSLRLFPLHWTMDLGREKFRKEVSDHLPFVASFRIDRSRD